MFGQMGDLGAISITLVAVAIMMVVGQSIVASVANTQQGTGSPMDLTTNGEEFMESLGWLPSLTLVLGLSLITISFFGKVMGLDQKTLISGDGSEVIDFRRPIRIFLLKYFGFLFRKKVEK